MGIHKPSDILRNTSIKPDMFVHLHSHSHFSVKDGSIPVDRLADIQIENGSKAVCLTDHGNMAGTFYMYDHIKNNHAGIKAIAGCELYVSLTRKELFEFLPKQKDYAKDERKRVRTILAKRYHQILLAKNKVGYQNLVKIHNEAWENGFYHNPNSTKEMIFANAEGLIATTTCLASIWAQAIMDGRIDDAERELREWKNVFGEDFYVELQPTTSKAQKLVNVELIKLARKTNTKMVITNDVHYIDEQDHELHYTLLNLDNLRKKAEGQETGKMWEFDVDDLYIKRLDQMKQSWYDLHKSDVFTESVFDETIHTIAEVIEKVDNYTLESKPLLPDITNGADKFQFLQNVAVEGFKEKVAKGAIPKYRLSEYEDRLVHELKVIHDLGVEDYFNILTVLREACDVTNTKLGPGRGSAAGSLLLWFMGITSVDPIKHKLHFERFLNMSRRSKLIL